MTTVFTAQRPLISGYGPATTAEQVIRGHNLQGKTAIVTGGYSGIGLETTRVLSEAGAVVIVPARTMDKARKALAGLERVELASLDLMNPASIDAFARQFLGSQRPLHLLINNAGIMAVPLSRDNRGNESQFSANHLGHFHLTLRLWPALINAHGARVVALTSRGHRFAGVDFDDPNFERRPYDKWMAYGQSKSANSLFALGLDSLGQAHGIRAFSVHPGAVLSTDLTRHLTNEDLPHGLTRRPDGSIEIGPSAAQARFFKTIPQGAATTIWCATSQMLDGLGSVYCEDCDVAPLIPGDSRTLKGVAPSACDPDLAEKLWKLSEAHTGVALSDY